MNFPAAERRAGQSQGGGFSRMRLARMRETLLRHVGSARLPGLVALISRRGVEHAHALGTLAFDNPAPMRRDTIFRLAPVFCAGLVRSLPKTGTQC